MMLQALGNAPVLPMPGGLINGAEDLLQSMRVDGLARPGAQAPQFDRRTAVRFPIEQDVRYKVFTRTRVEVGISKTVNMSSTGVLFTTERPMALGEKLEVAVNWPALLDHKCALKLVVTGRVVRSVDRTAAIAIDRYEFRTQGIRGLI